MAANLNPLPENPYKVAGAIFDESRGFSGLDLWHNPQDQTGGVLLQADAFLTQAAQLVVRPGIQAQLASSPGVASYKLCTFTDGSGNTWLLMCAGGKIYKSEQNSSTYTEIKDETGSSYDFEGALLSATVMNDYVYLDDGAHPAVRIDLTSGFPAYSMTAPTQPPVVALTNAVIDTPTAAQWSAPNPTPNPTITTTSANLTIESGTGANTIDINTSTYIADQLRKYMTVVLADSSGNTGHFYVTAVGTGTLTATFTPASGDSAVGTVIDSGASVQINGGLLANGAFDVGGGCDGASELVGAPWFLTDGPYNLAGGNSPDYGPTSCSQSQVRVSGHNWSLLLDNKADAIGQTIYAPLNNTVSWPNPSQLTRCANFAFSAQIRAQVTGSKAALALVMVAYDSSGQTLAILGPTVLTPSTTSAWETAQAAFNFTQILDADPDHYVLTLSSGPNNVAGNGIWVATTELTALADGPLVTGAGAAQVQWTAPYNTIGGSYMVRDYGTGGKDFSSVGILAMPISSAIPLTDLYIRFGFVEVGQTTINWSNTIQFNSPTNDTAYCDITTVPDTVLANVRYLYILASVDLPVTDITPGSSANILTFGPLTAAGNLGTDGLTYLWYVTESIVIDRTVATDTNATTGTTATQVTSAAFAGASVGGVVYVTGGAGWTTGYYTISALAGNTASLSAAPAAASTSGGQITVVISLNDVVTSNPSLPSATVTPTDTQAEADIDLPSDCPLNTPGSNPSGQYLLYSLWRLGGQWDTPLLIATVDSRYDVAYGNDVNNPYYSFDSSAGSFLDNTPDLQLSEAQVLSFSRDPFPPNAACNAEWQGRLWKAVGNLLYSSWLYNTDTSAPLYTTLEQNLDDPNYATAGLWFPASPDPTDTIVRLIPFGTPAGVSGDSGGSNQFGGGLLVLCKRSRWLVQGTDATNFELIQYPTEDGGGLVAFNGFARISEKLIVYMGQNRLHMFPPAQDGADIGLPIQPVLYPAYPQQQTLQNPAALAQSWMCFHDHYLFVGAPTPGDTQPTVIWVYDLWSKGWTRWTSQENTSAISCAPNAVMGSALQLFLFDASTGNIKLVTGTQDIAAEGDAGTAISWTAMFHAMRPGFFYRYKLHPLYYRRARLEWVEIEIIYEGTLTVLAQAWMPTPSGFVAIAGKSNQQTVNMVGDGAGVRVMMPPGLIEGEYITLSLSGQSTGPTSIRGVRGWVSQTTEDPI